MASVTQCDVCNNVVKHEQSFYVEVYRVRRDDSRGDRLQHLDICPDCYSKLCATLKLEVKK